MKIKNPFSLPNPNDNLSLEELIERNLDLYHDNLRAISSAFGGELVTDKHLSGWLMKVLNRYYRKHKEYPERLTPPQYPMEEFVPLQIEFTVNVLGVPTTAHKWYFVRKTRGFSVAN